MTPIHFSFSSGRLVKGARWTERHPDLAARGRGESTPRPLGPRGWETSRWPFHARG